MVVIISVGYRDTQCLNNVLHMFLVYRYAGPMERGEAEQILTNRSDGTFLVRQRIKDAAEFAISIK